MHATLGERWAGPPRWLNQERPRWFIFSFNHILTYRLRVRGNKTRGKKRMRTLFSCLWHQQEHSLNCYFGVFVLIGLYLSFTSIWPHANLGDKARQFLLIYIKGLWSSSEGFFSLWDVFLPCFCLFKSIIKKIFLFYVYEFACNMCICDINVSVAFGGPKRYQIPWQ